MLNSKRKRRYYRIGGIGIRVDMPDFHEAVNLTPFRTQKLIPDLILQGTMVDSIRTDADNGDKGGWVKDGDGLVLFDDRDHRPVVKTHNMKPGHIRVEIDKSRPESCSTYILLKILQLPHYMLSRNAVFLHASYIEYNGSAILFTAKSQTGKSTQAALWEQHRGAFVVNGDRALLRKENGVWMACGSPYCGTSKICHDRTLPIRAIVILSQAKTNTARRAATQAAFAALLSGCSFDPADADEVKVVTDIAGELIMSVPFYTLACMPDERAVAELEKIL